MKSSLVRRAFGALCLLASAFVPSVSAAIINNPTDWNNTFNSIKGASYVPLKTPGDVPDNDHYAWEGYQWISAYIALAQSTGSSTYMDKAKEIIDYMLSQRDDVRFASTPLSPEYWSAPTYYLYHNGTPAPGWRRLINGNSHVSQLIDGRICEAIILWCELARRGFPQYETDIAGYLPKVKQSLDIHQPSFKDIPPGWSVPEENFYNPALPAASFNYWRDERNGGPPDPDQPFVWSGFVPVNHACTIARAMLGYDHLTGGTEYRDKVQAIVNYYLNALDPARPGIAAWMYSPLDPNAINIGKMEDLDHAAVTLSLIIEAYRVGGYGVTSTHVARLVQSFHTFYDDASKGVHPFVDGSGTVETGTQQNAAIGAKPWLWLSQFDPTIAAKVRAAYNQHLSDTNIGHNRTPHVFSGWANLLYWESLIAGTAAFDDASIGVPGPGGAPGRELYTDAVNLLKWPSHSNATSSEVSSGAFEGAKHRVIDYNIANWQWAIAQFSFSPAENGADWGGIRIAYKNTGPAAINAWLSDGTNSMNAVLPPQAGYAPRTLLWADFSGYENVNKSALTTFRIIANGVASGSGTVSFDDLRLVGEPAGRELYNDATDLLKWPYASNATTSELGSGGYEGSKHRVMNYNITNWQWAIAQFSFYPAENGAAWGGIRLAYKTTGSAVFNLTLSDGTNPLTAVLPPQSSYAPRTLRWSDFSGTGVNKAALTTFRIIVNGVASGSGTVHFDDLKFVE
jgi:hypothetical protein